MVQSLKRLRRGLSAQVWCVWLLRSTYLGSQEGRVLKPRPLLASVRSGVDLGSGAAWWNPSSPAPRVTSWVNCPRLKKVEPLFLSLIAKLVIVRLFSKPLSGNNICRSSSLVSPLACILLCIVQFGLVGEGSVDENSAIGNLDYYGVLWDSPGEEVCHHAVCFGSLLCMPVVSQAARTSCQPSAWLSPSRKERCLASLAEVLT